MTINMWFCSVFLRIWGILLCIYYIWKRANDERPLHYSSGPLKTVFRDKVGCVVVEN